MVPQSSVCGPGCHPARCSSRGAWSSSLRPRCRWDCRRRDDHEPQPDVPHCRRGGLHAHRERDRLHQWLGGALERRSRTTTFVSATRLTAAIPATDIATAGTVSVTVVDAGGGTSNAQTFTINNPVPTNSSLSPTSATAGGPAFTLTVTGTQLRQHLRGPLERVGPPTTYVSATQLQATITAADIATAGTASVTVFNPTPGGGTSSARTFTINNPVPTTTGLARLRDGGRLGLHPDGDRDQLHQHLRGPLERGQPHHHLRLGDAADGGHHGHRHRDGRHAPVTVFNPTPGGGTSNAQTFTIVTNPVPTTTGLAPTSATAGGPAFTLTVTGTNFVTGSTVSLERGGAHHHLRLGDPAHRGHLRPADIATAGTRRRDGLHPDPGRRHLERADVHDRPGHHAAHGDRPDPGQ